MGRPPLPIGSWGDIAARKVGKTWEASARFRDYDGKTRPVRRTGTTKAAAVAALREALTGREAPVEGEVTASARVHVAALVFFDELETAVAADKAAPSTLTRYREVWRVHIEPALGERLIREVSVPVVDRFLKALTKSVGAPTAKIARNVLSGICKVAVRHGALTTSPVRDAAPVHVKKPEPKALTVAEIARLRAEARAHASGQSMDGQPRRGRPPLPDTADAVDVLLATGARISEVLALRWSDVDLDAEPAISITGTLTKIDGVWQRRPIPKTDRSNRRLWIPAFAVETLLRRRVEVVLSNDLDAVFPSTVGTWRDPGNVRKRLREIAQRADVPEVTPHTLRRTIATWLDKEHDLETAAAQLGDHRDTTERHYVQRRYDGPDVTVALQRLVDAGAGEVAA